MSCADGAGSAISGSWSGSRETLDQYVTETWVRTHAVTLAPKTAKTYALLYDLHIAPYLGTFKLSELTPELIARWQADRIAAGAGRMSVLKSLQLLGSILQLALESERIARNPVRTGAQGAAAAAAGGAAAAAGDGRGDARGVSDRGTRR